MKNHRITHRLTIDTDRPTPEPIPVHQAPDPAAVEGCMLDVVRSETVVHTVPVDEKLRADLRAVKKEVSASERVRFIGETQDSHCDRFWAKGLRQEPPATTPKSARRSAGNTPSKLK